MRYYFPFYKYLYNMYIILRILWEVLCVCHRLVHIMSLPKICHTTFLPSPFPLQPSANHF